MGKGFCRFHGIQQSYESSALVSFGDDQAGGEKELEEKRITVQLPTWLLPRRYQFRGSEAYTGWKFCIRSSHVLPSSSYVFQPSKEGNLAALRQHFLRRKASIFDVDEQSRTTLHVSSPFKMKCESDSSSLQYAVVRGHCDVVRFLLENGADADSRSNFGKAWSGGRAGGLKVIHFGAAQLSTKL